MATIEDFVNLDIRIGTVIQAEVLPKARVPAIKMVLHHNLWLIFY